MTGAGTAPALSRRCQFMYRVTSRKKRMTKRERPGVLFMRLAFKLVQEQDIGTSHGHSKFGGSQRNALHVYSTAVYMVHAWLWARGSLE